MLTRYHIDSRSQPASLPEESFRFEPRVAAAFAVILGLLWVSSAAGAIILLLACLHSVRGPRQSVEALAVLSFVLIINPGIAEPDISTIRWLVLLCAFGRMIWDTLVHDMSLPRVMGPLTLFAGTCLVFAFLVSMQPMVSVLKIVTFYAGAGTALTGFYRTAYMRHYWYSAVLTFFLFVLFTSLPLYGTSLGYFKNGRGFQGILTHPQTFGPVVAPMAAMLTAAVLFGRNRSKILISAAIVSWMGMYTSQSRTSIGAFVIGFGLVCLIGLLWNDRWRTLLGQVLSRASIVFILGGLLIVAALQWSNLQENITTFLTKGETGGSLTEIVEESRGELIDRSMENFYDYPVTGIGFGIPSNFRMNRVETGAFGLPTSASVEKGFLFSAVLEETGLVGGIMVLVLLIVLIMPVARADIIAPFWMLTSSLLINAGEMILFSVGGMGLYFWMIMAFSYMYGSTSSTARPG